MATTRGGNGMSILVIDRFGTEIELKERDTGLEMHVTWTLPKRKPAAVVFFDAVPAAALANAILAAIQVRKVEE